MLKCFIRRGGGDGEDLDFFGITHFLYIAKKECKGIIAYSVFNHSFLDIKNNE